MSPPAEVTEFFARADIWDNLLPLNGLAARIGLRLPTVAMWKARHAGFPDPVVPTMRADKDYAYLALYWWPDFEEFMRRHGLPGRPGRPGGRGNRCPGCAGEREAS